MRVGLLVSGFKGFKFLEILHQDISISFVASYKRQDSNDFFLEIRDLCLKCRYKFIDNKTFSNKNNEDADIIFVVGWQFLIKSVDDRYIIFHDSLLPRFRGFSPTVTTLIAGEPQIGVTALKPCEVVDSGEIYDQQVININYPLKIQTAYLLLSQAYVGLAKRLLIKKNNGSLISYPQDESKASYSIWRDQYDYYIDWKWNAEKISRFVDALGYPYERARTNYQSRTIFIDEVTVVKDKNFEERQIGKISFLYQGNPEIICGEGIIKIIAATNQDGTPVIFNKMRERFYQIHKVDKINN